MHTKFPHVLFFYALLSAQLLCAQPYNTFILPHLITGRFSFAEENSAATNQPQKPKKIQYLTLDQIRKMLAANVSATAHQELAQVAADNYNKLTGYSIAGYQWYTTAHACAQYAQLFEELDPEYHSVVLAPVLKNIQKYNILTLIARTGQELHADILAAFSRLRIVDLSVYTDHDLHELLKVTKSHNQTPLAKAIAKNVHIYNGWHFYGMLNHCTDSSREIIIAAIIRDCTRNPTRYDDFTRNYIAQYCTEKQKNLIAQKAS